VDIVTTTIYGIEVAILIDSDLMAMMIACRVGSLT
jgi:hypothetical protein